MAFNNGLVIGSEGTAAANTPGQGFQGWREELADYIAVVDAKSTPFVSMAPKGKDLGNMQFSWQVDNYSAPNVASSSTAGIPDGADVTVASGASGNASAARIRLWNYAQVFRRVHRTGFIAEIMNTAGVGTSETARGVAKRLVELKRDMEATFCATNQVAVGESNVTPSGYLTSSLGSWTGTNGGSAPYLGSAPSPFNPATGAIDSTTTTATLSEGAVQNVLTAIYGNTGVFRDYDVILGPTLKRAFTSLTVNAQGTATATTPNTAIIGTGGVAATAIRTFNTELSGDVYKSSIDIFEGDFGKLILHPTTFIQNIAGTAQPFKGYVLPMEMTEVRYCKLAEVKDLPDAGGGPIKLIQAIAGLVVKNPSGIGYFNFAS